MLMQTLLVSVPALEERDADVAEYGHLGIKVRAAFGEAAMDAGAPDECEDERTRAIDTIANILHCLGYSEAGMDMRAVLDMALHNYEEERKG